MLIDNGVGNGFTIGIKYPDTHSTQSSIAGTYRFLDIETPYNGSGSSVGYYTLPATGGNASVYIYNGGGANEITINSNNFAPVSEVNNMYKMTTEDGGTTYTTWMIILPGEAMLHFTASPTELMNYGVSVKIN